MKAPIIFLFIVFSIPDKFRSDIFRVGPEMGDVLKIATANINLRLVSLSIVKLRKVEYSFRSKQVAINDHSILVKRIDCILVQHGDVWLTQGPAKAVVAYHVSDRIPTREDDVRVD